MAGVVEPPEKNTLAGLTVRIRRLLLLRVTVTPPGGAGVPNVMGNGTELPRAAVTLGRVIEAGATTVTFTVFSAILGGAPTRMTVEPAAAPVTGTIADVPKAGMVTLAGRAATLELSEASVTVSGAGAGAERVKVRFCVVPRLRVRLAGPNSDAATRTIWVLPARPKAEALMSAVPKLTPVTLGCARGVVAPAGI
jgi:hypothetical protein